MDVVLLRNFQQQVLLQCEFLLYATDDLGAALKAGDVNRIFYAIQNLLSAAANVSKALWGQAGSRTEERKELRESIGVSDNSSLRAVTMRNNFEHFDERLDTWWKESKNHNIVDLNIGNRGMIVGLEPNECLRNFDPVSGDLYFFSQDFNIKEILREVHLLLPKLTIEANKPYRQE